MSPLPAACAVTIWCAGAIVLGRTGLADGPLWKTTCRLTNRVAKGTLVYPLIAMLVELTCRGCTDIPRRLIFALTCAAGGVALGIASAVLLTVLWALLRSPTGAPSSEQELQ